MLCLEYAFQECAIFICCLLGNTFFFERKWRASIEGKVAYILEFCRCLVCVFCMFLCFQHRIPGACLWDTWNHITVNLFFRHIHSHTVLSCTVVYLHHKNTHFLFLWAATSHVDGLIFIRNLPPTTFVHEFSQ